jgi:hypothetical protein
LEKIKELFEKLDNNSKGILKSEHILELIQVKNGSLLSLYSKHFYNLIPKKDPKGDFYLFLNLKESIFLNLLNFLWTFV